MADKYDRFQVADIDPIILVRKLIAKARRDSMQEEQPIELSLIDFYPAYMTKDLLEAELCGLDFEVFDSLTEQFTSLMSSVAKTEIVPHTSSVSAIAYYNTFFEKKLEFLRRGGRYFPSTDGSGNTSIITDYSITHADGLESFTVRVQLGTLIQAVKQFVADYDHLHGKMHQLWESAIESNAASIIKQGQLFMGQVAQMQDLLGLDRVNIGIRDWGMRITAWATDEGDLILHPFNMTYRGKSILPICLEARGLIDIHDLSLTNKPSDYADANLQYTVSRPCVTNIFGSDNTAIPLDQRPSLTESQIVIIEKIFQAMNDALAFAGKPDLRHSFTALLIWFVKKVSFCLAEETFLQKKVADYLDHHDEGQVRLEDEVFLPTMYEKLVSSFGEQRVIKKPEKYNGEIDILFDNCLPVELKAWREKHKGIEETSDERFPHLGQAATYASHDRVGFMVILDISSPCTGVRNIENCYRVLSKEFDVNKQLPTKIVVLLFDCNHCPPSRL